jgi:hypothetical protein
MDSEDWPIEAQELPANLLELAQLHAGGSIAQIDGSMLPDPDGYVPPEAIVGAYIIDENGVPTGTYRRNPSYGKPILDDWSRLENRDHWFGWLPDSPGKAVRSALENGVSKQVPGTIIEWVKIIEEPEFLTGGPRQSDDSEKIVVRRAALAVKFALSVRPPNGKREFVVGSFSWVATGLDSPGSRRDRTWFDVGMGMTKAAALLQERVWEVDRATGDS